MLTTLNSLVAQFCSFREDLHNIHTSIATINSRLDRHDSDIASLKSDSAGNDKLIKDLSVTMGNLPTAEQHVAATIRELDDITKRKSNILLFNLAEDITSEVNASREADEKTVADILESLQLTGKLKLVNLSRIGESVASSTSPRPLKLRFTSQDNAQVFLSTFWRIKKQSSTPSIPSPLSASQDRTPTQLSLYRQCRKKLLEMPPEEQLKYKIVFYEFAPKIIKQRQSPGQN